MIDGAHSIIYSKDAEADRAFLRDVPGLPNVDVGEALLCDDVMGWGVLTQVTLPGGGSLGVYEPRHARPKPLRLRRG